MRAHRNRACIPKGLLSQRRYRIGRPEAVPLPAGTYIGSTGPRGLHYLNKTVDVAMAGYGDKIHCTLLADGAEHVIDS
jgi:DNA gyrase/topoisomerase IV subunit B